MEKDMKVFVTGAKGFIGKNLIAQLKNIGHKDIYQYERDTPIERLMEYTKDCDFVFHLGGVNRPKEEKEFMEGNAGLTSSLLDALKKNGNKAPILVTSSIQADLDNPYGRSKKAGEDILFAYERETGAKVFVYRLPNVFGKWCRPNYNSAIATFCHNIAHHLPIKVHDPFVVMNLVYIDDLVEEMLRAMEGKGNQTGMFCSVPVSYSASLGSIASKLQDFAKERENLEVPNMGNELEKKLYSTYLSYLPKEEFSYPLKMNKDERGSFTEFLRTKERGQVSVNISKPGITKGQHWHNTKNEKFLVVKGRGLIQFRKIGEEEVISYHVSGEKLEVVDIPPGYTHSIKNEGEEEMVTILWANEPFDIERPDTYFQKV